jgi:hypothetical protein
MTAPARTPRGPVRRVISGGRTGADRGGLDAAIELGLDHGGFCPRGRRAEDGRVPDRYHLCETRTARYAERTEANVTSADGTLIVTRGPLAGGSALTAALARGRGVPLLVVDLSREAPADAARRVRAWIDDRAIGVLNVSGPRESHCPGIAADTRALVLAALTAQATGGAK